MTCLFRLLLLFVIAIGYKIAVNNWYLRRTRTLAAEHNDYLAALARQDGSQSWEFVKKTVEIKALFKRANIQDQVVSWMEPAGFGYVQQAGAAMYENISAANAEIQSKVVNAFHRAEGVYEQRQWEALSPFYWVELLLHLPSHALEYAGLVKGSVWGKLANMIAWVVGVVAFVTSLPDFVGLQKWVSHQLAALVAWFH